MMKARGLVWTLMMTLGACAPKATENAGAHDPSTPSASDGSAALNESHQHTDGAEPATSPEDQTTLKFPFCERDVKTPFSEKTEGAAFRAIVLFRILPSGKTAEHCYLRVEGEIRWEEKSLGNVAEWTYPVEFAGEQRERTVTFRLKQPPAAAQPAGAQPPTAQQASTAQQAPAAGEPPASKQPAEASTAAAKTPTTASSQPTPTPPAK